MFENGNIIFDQSSVQYKARVDNPYSLDKIIESNLNEIWTKIESIVDVFRTMGASKEANKQLQGRIKQLDALSQTVINQEKAQIKKGSNFSLEEIDRAIVLLEEIRDNIAEAQEIASICNAEKSEVDKTIEQLNNISSIYENCIKELNDFKLGSLRLESENLVDQVKSYVNPGDSLWSHLVHIFFRVVKSLHTWICSREFEYLNNRTIKNKINFQLNEMDEHLSKIDEFTNSNRIDLEDIKNAYVAVQNCLEKAGALNTRLAQYMDIKDDSIPGRIEELTAKVSLKLDSLKEVLNKASISEEELDKARARVAALLQMDVDEQLPVTEDQIKCFAQHHCASLITNSEWEGLFPRLAYEYWGELIDLPAGALPVAHGLNVRELERVRASNRDLLIFHGMLKMGADPVAIADKIRERCAVYGRNFCYLPAGWKDVDGGHHVTLKARLLENGEVALSLLNYGAGMGYHLDTLEAGSKTKLDFQSAEYALSLDSSDWRNFIPCLTQLLDDPRIHDKDNLKRVHQVNKEDLYGLFKLYGKRIDDPTRASVRQCVTPQRAGTCSLTNTRAGSRDVLLSDPKLPISKIKRFQFSMKSASLVKMSKALRGMEEGENKQFLRLFLQNALEEFDVRTHKLHPEILTTQELAICWGLSDAIKKNMTVPDADVLLEPLPDFSCCELISDEKRVCTPSVKMIEDKVVQPVAVEQKQELVLAMGGCSPEGLRAYLQQACDYFANQKKNTPEGTLLIRKFMLTLPSTTGASDDPFWRLIPGGEIPVVLEQLATLARYSMCRTLSRDQYECEVFLMAFDMAAQLAEYDPNLKLGGEFAFSLDDIYRDQYFYRDAESFRNIERIINNFEKRVQGRKRVFRSAINFGEDSTQEYVMKHLLSEEKRMQWCKDVKGQVHPPNYSDQALFRDLITSTGLRSPYLPASIQSILSLSHSVHCFGSGTSKYFDTGFGYVLNVSTNDQNSYITSSKIQMPYYRKSELYPMSKIEHKESDFLENVAFRPALVERNMEYFSLSDQGSHRTDYLSAKEAEGDFTKLSPALDEEFRAMEATPHLQIQKALEWAQYNPDQLSDVKVQYRLLTLITEYGKMGQALRDFPDELLHLIRLFQVQVRDYYGKRPEDLSTLLWFTEVCHILQDYVEESSIDFDRETWVDTRKILQDRLNKTDSIDEKTQIAKQLIHSYINKSELTEEDYLLLFSCQSLLSLEKVEEFKRYRGADLANAKIFVQQGERIRKALLRLSALQKPFDAYFNALMLGFFGLNLNVSWSVKGDQVVDSLGEFSISLLDGKITKFNESFDDISKEISDDPLFQAAGSPAVGQRLVFKKLRGARF